MNESQKLRMRRTRNADLGLIKNHVPPGLDGEAISILKSVVVYLYLPCRIDESGRVQIRLSPSTPKCILMDTRASSNLDIYARQHSSWVVTA